MTYHEINIFSDFNKAQAKAREHEAAGRTNVTVTPKEPTAGYESVTVYDNTDGKSELMLDKDAPRSLFIVESDGA